MIQFIYRNPLLQTALEAGIAGMKVLRRGQRSEVGVVETKVGDGNNTIWSKWDKASEAAILPILLSTDINVRSEEVGLVGDSSRTDFVWIVDPLDGSKPFVLRAITSTLSISLFDLVRERIVASIVMLPATGQVWISCEGEGVWTFWWDGDLYTDLLSAKRCRVWDGAFGPHTITLLDCYRDFKLADYPVTGNNVLAACMADLFANTTGLYNFGSNCYHYALLALGGNGMAAALTTCRGGPHDIAPVHLVLEAGGVAQGFSNKTGELVCVDPLNVLACNFMLAANNQANLDIFVDRFTAHFG